MQTCAGLPRPRLPARQAAEPARTATKKGGERTTLGCGGVVVGFWGRRCRQVGTAGHALRAFAAVPQRGDLDPYAQVACPAVGGDRATTRDFGHRVVSVEGLVKSGAEQE